MEIKINKDVAELERQLAVRIVHMAYVKKDGSMRDAWGTRCLALIPAEYHPNGRSQHKPCAWTLSYWDTVKGGWRSLIRKNVLGFIEDSEQQETSDTWH